MLYHAKCGGSITIDIAQNISTVASFGIGYSELRTSLIKLNFNKGAANARAFYCVNCDRVIEPEEVVGKCMHCGETFPADKLYIPECGGVYCEKCAKEEFKSYKKKNVLVILKTCKLVIK